MQSQELQEQVLSAWIGISSMLKESRMMKEMTYNEAIIMKLVYDQYKTDGRGRISVQYILKQTNMLKSLANRTINSLCVQGYLKKERSSTDARQLFVRPVLERIPDFLAVHEHSLEVVRHVIKIIGEENAKSFADSYRRLSDAEIVL